MKDTPRPIEIDDHPHVRDANDPAEIEHWSRELNVKPDRFREAVARIGPSLRAIAAYLNVPVVIKTR